MCSGTRSAQRRTVARAPGPEAWRTPYPRCRPPAAYAATYASTVGASSQGRRQHRSRLRRHLPSPRRSRNPLHHGRALAGQEVRLLSLRPGMRSGAGVRPGRVPLRAALFGAQPASPSEPAANRSSDPRSDPISRFYPTTNPIRGIQSMNLIELNRALHELRMGGMVATLETRLLQAQADAMAPIDLISTLVSDELACRSQRLLARRHKQAQFRDANKQLDNFDFQFNPKMNRSLVFDLAAAGWVGRREDSLLLGPPGSGKSHIAQAIGHAVIQQGYRVLYRETHALLEELADATLDGKRKQHMELLTTVPLLIIDDLGMRKLPLTAAEELLEIIMRRYERASTLITSNRPVDDWGKLLGDSAAVTAMLDRLLHHGHILKCGPRSWRTKTGGVGDAQ